MRGEAPTKQTSRTARFSPSHPTSASIDVRRIPPRFIRVVSGDCAATAWTGSQAGTCSMRLGRHLRSDHPLPCLYLWTRTRMELTTACLASRSEEHTSELQSLRHLVCR